MTNCVVLDTGVLGQLVHPRRFPQLAAWLEDLAARDFTICVPEIADYELRRKLLHLNFTTSLLRLEELRHALAYLPLDTPAMRLAAELWADARRRGLATAPPEALDGDVILAAQARRAATTLGLAASDPIVATNNVGHLARFVSAQPWEQIR